MGHCYTANVIDVFEVIKDLFVGFGGFVANARLGYCEGGL